MCNVEELGNQAYKKALFEDYNRAISILNQAIAKFPSDPRLYNNRSFCYYKLKDYKRSLKDAEFMVKSFPEFSRGYYRKAEALIEQEKYKEAESALRRFLKFEPRCEEAKFLLTEVQITVLCKGGKCWVQDAMTALKLTDYDTKMAAQFLEVGSHLLGRKGAKSFPKSEIYYSDEENVENSPSSCSMVRAQKDSEYDPYTDPNNPYNSSSIWVGNVTRRVTPEKLKAIFGKYGKFKGDIIVHQNSCAFINYTEPKMAAACMKKFPQNYPVEDTSLVIRYPQSNCKPSKPLSNGKKKKN